MKSTILLTALFTSFCFGSYEDWTSKDGRTAQLELVKTTGEGDALAGEFRMKNGKTVTIKASDLDDAGSAKLKEAATKPAEAATPAATESVFDAVLDGNLVKLDGKKLAKYKDAKQPQKFYIFYYTASWCGPCQAFTPSLVTFYNEVKPGNDNFELVLITSDDDEKAMAKYAADKSMPWPQLNLDDVTKFKKKFNHGVTGIPSVVVCDLEGKIVAKTTDLNAIKKIVK
jgi:nucleoredoxin